jgi:hypothetical protein
VDVVHSKEEKCGLMQRRHRQEENQMLFVEYHFQFDCGLFEHACTVQIRYKLRAER